MYYSTVQKVLGTIALVPHYKPSLFKTTTQSYSGFLTICFENIPFVFVSYRNEIKQILPTFERYDTRLSVIVERRFRRRRV